MKFASKKIHAVLGVAMSASLVLAACGSGSGSESSPAASATTGASASAAPASASPAQPKLEPYTIKMFVPGIPQKEQNLVNEEISKYLKDKINVTLDMQVIDWGSWADKMNLKYASNEVFDITWTTSWDNWVGKINNKSIIQVDDLMAKHAKEAMQIIDPKVLNGIKYNGKTYGMPTNKEFAANKGFLVRKDLVEKYKFDLSTVKKPEDMEPFFEVIKKNEPGMIPFLSGKSNGLPIALQEGSFISAGSSATNLGAMDRNTPELKLIDVYTDSRYVDILKLANKWYKAGYINKDAATLSDFGGTYRSGKVFAFPETLKPGKDTEVSQASGLPWVQVEFTKPLITTNSTLGNMLSISRTSKDPERVMMFLNLLYTDKTLVNMIAFGIEGKHFVKKSDNTVDFPQGMTAQTSGYSLGAPYMFGNQFNDYLWAGEDPQKWEKFKKFNADADEAKGLGFIFNNEKVKNEISAYNNALAEYFPGLITGTLDPVEYLPKMVEKLKAAGMDKINAEVQTQLNEWAQANKK
ncbi:MAG: extracellular solute-binding protein [Paenibacillaceae bacterium]|jgi:putative aldouronate transport system substrate-binding protein|nr:extracellular solute-binding protein [Paenibacillaceae bacterium]